MRVLTIVALCSGPAALSSCSRQGPLKEKYRQTKVLLGTFVQVDVCYGKEQAPSLDPLFAEVWARLDAIQGTMNVYDENSEISKINRAYPDALAVDPDLYRLLEAALDYSRVTQGAFDITVGPLIALWKQAAADGRIPSREKIEAVKNNVGPAQIRLLSPGRVQLQGRDVRIDLGGVAKGYAVDEAARILKARGFNDFFIDAGGDIYAHGQSCAGRPWRIGIRNPRQKDAIIDVIELRDAAVTTSGDYEQYVEIEGRKFSHILDPRTGYPQSGVISATVVAPSAEEADALSTALCVLSEEEGMEVIRSLGENFKAYLVRETDGPEKFRITADSGFKRLELHKK